MILNSGHATEYLNAYKDGKIPQGLPIGCLLDDYLRFKKAQSNIILGHDNVGKTDWTIWYMLALSSQHDLKWVVWVGENNPAQVVRKLIQMYSGRPFMDLTHKEIRRYEMKMEYWFTFVDNKKLYTPDDMIDIFSNTKADGCLMDPFTGLDRSMQYADNYSFMNKTRLFCNQTDKTLYIVTHPNTESGRASMIYPQGHDWFGHLMPPMKAHIEGGKPFLNRVDDMIVIHRLTKHMDMKYMTMINVEKVKNNETGGEQTLKDRPVMFNFNHGLGYREGLNDCIKRPPKRTEQQTSLELPTSSLDGFKHSDFETEVDNLMNEPDDTYNNSFEHSDF